MFWFIALSIAVLAALFLAAPLLRAGGESPDSASASHDAEVYRDQLAEIDRDEKAGLIDAEEAKQARLEIARRLLAATEAAKARETGLGRKAAIALALFLCLVVPVGGAALYARIGAPGQPDQPLAERMASPQPDINVLIARTEAHLAENPTDGRGWELLAPIYMRQMRAADAANAYKNAIRYLGGNAERFGALGEALTAAAQGQVTQEARDAFDKAVAANAFDPRARFYLAIAEAQAGRPDEAIARLKALADESPKDAPWQAVVAAQIERISAEREQLAKAPGNPDAAAIEAAQGLSEADRKQMIRTMVETLDERLKTDPDNFEGWLRLIRSFAVLGEEDKAKDAVKRGLAAFPAESENGKAIIALSRELGLEKGEVQ